MMGRKRVRMGEWERGSRTVLFGTASL